MGMTPIEAMAKQEPMRVKEMKISFFRIAL